MPNNNNAISDIIAENTRRNNGIYATFNPITGEGSIGERVCISISDFPIPLQWVPKTMLGVPLVKKIAKHGSLKDFMAKELKITPNDVDRRKIINQFTRIRSRHDFPFWAATFVYIKNKGGGDDVLFRLTYPQRRFVERLEQLRLANKPIRIVLLKARQWGGSTTSQIYMAWLQLLHKVGLNSIIVSQVQEASIKIKDMFNRMISAYPVEMLHEIGEAYDTNEKKLERLGGSDNTQRVPQRNFTISIGTAEKPDSVRSGDYSLVHCSEVGIWKKTEGKTPESIVNAACSGVLYRPLTMIVYESTANGVGNFFHREYLAAADPNVKSQFEAMFVSWFDIEHYTLPFASDKEQWLFAQHLYDNRNNDFTPSDREETGKYLWWLWEKGATLEGINWYIEERSKYNDHGGMASEYPSDDIEAFVNSGANVFDRHQVEALRRTCRTPRYVGDVQAFGDEGKDALRDLRFVQDNQGALSVWTLPEIPQPTDLDYVSNRYLTVVDVGGRSNKADWSVIVVFDRSAMLDSDGRPSIVAQWYGHIDIDRLAWKAAQIAAFYHNSLLVIESNTLETHDRDRHVDGDQSAYILDQIKGVYSNLYARRQSADEIMQGLPRRYGFHTNTATKPMIISTLIKCVRDQLWVERDSRCLDELINYERKPNGSYGAVIGHHDDVLMTRAIGLHICFHEMDVPQIQPINNRMSATLPNNVISEASI